MGIKSVLKKSLADLISAECFIARKWVQHAYRRLMWAEWQLLPNPENFDHNIDLYYKWMATRDASWLERGIYNINAISFFGKPETVVELCCGDGFNTKNFYSLHCGKIYACDYDSKIIKHAQKTHNAENIIFENGDILNGIESIFPNIHEGSVDCILWDSAIAYFTEAETQLIMNNIKKILKNEGILSGNTTSSLDHNSQFKDHKREFRNKEALKEFLHNYFKNVIVIESYGEGRNNLHFYASDGNLPFTPEWKNWTL